MHQQQLCLSKNTFLAIGINIELVKIIKLSMSEHNLTKYAMPLP
jgi:hypothetical protein